MKIPVGNASAALLELIARMEIAAMITLRVSPQYDFAGNDLTIPDTILLMKAPVNFFVFWHKEARIEKKIGTTIWNEKVSTENLVA